MKFFLNLIGDDWFVFVCICGLVCDFIGVSLVVNEGEGGSYVDVEYFEGICCL